MRAPRGIARALRWVRGEREAAVVPIEPNEVGDGVDALAGIDAVGGRRSEVDGQLSAGSSRSRGESPRLSSVLPAVVDDGHDVGDMPAFGPILALTYSEGSMSDIFDFTGDDDVWSYAMNVGFVGPGDESEGSAVDDHAEQRPQAQTDREAQRRTAARPPLMPRSPRYPPRLRGEFDGEWMLVNPTADTASWLDRLRISGRQLRDADGLVFQLGESGDSVLLCGGRLETTPWGILRIGKSGSVQAYVRSSDEHAREDLS